MRHLITPSVMLRGTRVPGRTTHRDKHHWVPFFQEHADCFSMGSSVLTGTGTTVVMRPFLHLWPNNMLALSVLAGWSQAQSFFWFVRTEPDITMFVCLSGPSSFTWLLSHCSITNLSIHSANSCIHSFTTHSLTCSITYPLNSPSTY